MYIPSMPIIEKPTSFQMMEKGRKFTEARTLPELAAFIGTKSETLRERVKNRKYHQFYIPKAQGEKRLIETPDDALKSLQGQLNKHFQAAYLLVRPEAAYGSLIACSDEAEPRNIYTNALRHIGSKWLLNADIRKFFPGIRSNMVRKALQTTPFQFDDEAAECLLALTTYENRLPTGAPTSPILANIVCLSLDEQLQQLADENGWTYTRYIDDLTFSGKKRFTLSHLTAIEAVLSSMGFAMNHDKLRISRVEDKPVVTGLVLRKKRPDVSKTFLENLRQHIHLFHTMTTDAMLDKQIFSATLVQRYRTFINGQLQFVQFIRGEGDKAYVELQAAFQPRTY